MSTETISLSSEFILGSIQSWIGGLGQAPRVTALSDGRVAAVWLDTDNTGDLSFGDADVYARIFNADGSPATDAILVNTNGAGIQQQAYVTSLSDGGFMVSWLARHISSTATPDAKDHAFVRAFTSTGAPRSDQIQVSVEVTPPVGNSQTYSDTDRAFVLGLDGGGAVAISQYSSYEPTIARLVGADGQTLGAPVTVSQSSFGVDAVQLTDGTVVMAIYEGSTEGFSFRLSAPDLVSAPVSVGGSGGAITVAHGIPDDQGSSVVGPLSNAPTGTYLTARPDGGFMIAYKYDPDMRTDDPLDALRVVTFDNSGAVQSTVTLAYPGTEESAQYDFGRVTALEGGRFLITWQIAVAYGDYDLQAQIFEANGTPVTDPVTISQTTTGTQQVGQEVLLPNGDVMVVFIDGSYIPVDGVRDTLRGRFLDIPEAPDAPPPPEPAAGQALTGDATANLLTGDTGPDTLVGNAGADTLNGGDGNDWLYGDGVPVTAFGTEASQVYRLYQATLGRTPDAGGHASWTKIIAENANDLVGVAAGFVKSAEFQNTYGALDATGFINQLYNNVLGRNADANGLQHWLDTLNGNGTRQSVVVGFSESVEFKNATAAASSAFATAREEGNWADDVFRIYQATLGREPDQGGLLGWAAKLGAGQSLASVVAGFVNSAEFTNTYTVPSDSAFIELLYNNVLGRSADANGMQTWLSALSNGGQYSDVVIGLAQSVEFINSTASSYADWVRAQGTHDTLNGGAGNNVLSGGILSDAFVFDRASGGTHRVLDLEAWDTLDLNGFGYADAAALRTHLTQQGTDVVFSDQGVTITFEGATLAMFTDDMLV